MTATAILLDELEPDSSATAAPEETSVSEDAYHALAAELRARLACPVELRFPLGVTVEIDVPGSCACASWLAQRRRVRLPIVMDAPAQAPACREALSLLLQRAAAAVRKVTSDASSPALEVVVDGDLDSPEFIERLVSAFEAITVAARMVVAESGVLATDEVIATRYCARHDSKSSTHSARATSNDTESIP
ncbi:MAG TPA: hypothetical protein VGK20_13020 [Candidatus Binatia bacterium]|jgi:hypothetical protein